MCGIVGILGNLGGTAPDRLIRQMTASLAHRGPDGEGAMVRESVALGHRRLAIIDIATGTQPLSNEDGQIWITYNGEIYNYRELRTTLAAKGHIFRTASDTETVVHAYEEWGDACVERFRGMFAFGIADFRQRRLFLARDHLGIKPLWYLESDHGFAFASEGQALRCIPNEPFTLDPEALDQYLWLQYIPAPRTVFRNVRKLPPGHRMEVAFDGRIVAPPRAYWEPVFRPRHNRPLPEWIEALDGVLRDSVRAHLVADVPFGAFLSGGVDSSAVVKYMAQELDHPVRTFSLGFEEPEYDELAYARQVSQRWGTEHHEDIVKPDAVGILPQLVRNYGEPFGDSSAIPMFYVSRMAQRNVSMVLSGDGGDEAFAGYDSYRDWLNWLNYGNAPLWKRLLRPVANALRPGRYAPRKATLASWLTFIGYTPEALRRRLWRPEYAASISSIPEAFEEAFAVAANYPAGSKPRYTDTRTYLPFDLLTKVDIASMMHGLEVRTPLVDVTVVEFAATIPHQLLMGQGRDGAWAGKRLLKQVLAKDYPQEFLCRSKRGFAVPLSKWFSPGGSLRPSLQERLLDRGSPLNEFFEPRTIAMILDKSVSHQLWLLLFLDEWLRQNRASAVLGCAETGQPLLRPVETPGLPGGASS